ncbi:unnamed protein product [Lymnaea stagnalis]|uniref:Uncharacterized protein n=1 Tax=Lymnaea stagnalis TaxID=6523 RepID=A0AAV2HEZ5_LYMST
MFKLEMDNAPPSDNKSTLALKRLLHKYFKKLIAGLPLLETAEINSRKQVSSLANFLELYESLTKLDTRGMTLVSVFPDVQAKMMVKLSAEVDAKVDGLNDLILIFKEQHDLAYKTRTDAFNLCKSNKNSLSPELMMTGQPTVPPVSSMLFHLDEVERHLREIYWSRKFYLENILDKEVVNSENLVTLWSEDIATLLNTIKDCEEQTRFFLEEKI